MIEWLPAMGNYYQSIIKVTLIRLIKLIMLLRTFTIVLKVLDYVGKYLRCLLTCLRMYTGDFAACAIYTDVKAVHSVQIEGFLVEQQSSRSFTVSILLRTFTRG